MEHRDLQAAVAAHIRAGDALNIVADRDAVVRNGLARAYEDCEIMGELGLRALAGLQAGRPAGPESSVSKLYWSEYHRRATDLALRILGARCSATSRVSRCWVSRANPVPDGDRASLTL